MPIIARHHHSDPWRPLCAWPDDATVQWGRHGIVLGDKTSYQTAFFEVFLKNNPKADFLRGEGETLEAAEEDAFSRYRKAMACDHLFGRRGYLNGVGRCLRCGHLKSNVFKPISDLSAWRAPLDVGELGILWMGGLWPIEGYDDAQYRRRLGLRALVAGIKLPDPAGYSDRQAYEEACIDPILDYLESTGAETPQNAEGSVLDRLFSGFKGRLLAEELARRRAQKPGGESAAVVAE